MWTVLSILKQSQSYLAAKGVENPRLEAEVLLCAVLKCERIKLYVDFERPLTAGEVAKYRTYIAQRGTRQPVAYILGRKDFMGLELRITPACLVPRPETELLVEQAAHLIKNVGPKQPKLLDLGTGSGAILIALLTLLPEALGIGSDISPAALAVAKENALNLGVKERCGFVVSDLFGQLPRSRTYDAIISNPPYVRRGDLPGLDPEVRKEPLQALDGGIDGLDFYRRLTKEVPRHLSAAGLLAMEIGAEQGEAVKALCYDAGLKAAAVKKDLAGLDRMVLAAKEDSPYANLLLAAG